MSDNQATSLSSQPRDRAAAGAFAMRSIWGEDVVFEGVELAAPVPINPGVK